MGEKQTPAQLLKILEGFDHDQYMICKDCTIINTSKECSSCLLKSNELECYHLKSDWERLTQRKEGE